MSLLYYRVVIPGMLEAKIILENLVNLKFLTPGIILVFKVAVIIFSLVLFVSICFFLKRTSWSKFRFLMDLTEFTTYRPYGAKRLDKIWARIVKRIETGSASEHKLAVIEADSLLNEILERTGAKGETLGERLQQLTAKILPNIEAVWEAHKIRNNIVHDPDYRLTIDEARKALSIYEQALRDLQAF